MSYNVSLENYAVKASDLVDFMNSNLSYDTEEKTDRSGCSVVLELKYKINVKEFLQFMGNKAQKLPETENARTEVVFRVGEPENSDSSLNFGTKCNPDHVK